MVDGAGVYTAVHKGAVGDGAFGGGAVGKEVLYIKAVGVRHGGRVRDKRLKHN